MRKALSWSLLAICLLTLLGLGWAASSETALRWMVATGARWVPGDLSVREVRGTLLGPLSVEGLRYETAGNLIMVERASLAWRPFALLDGELHVQRFSVEDISLRLAASPETAPASSPPPTGFSLPLKLRVDEAGVRRFRLQQPDGTEQPIDSLRLSAFADDQRITIDALEVAAPQGSVGVTGEVDTADLKVDLRLDWRVPLPGMKPLEGRGSLRGSGERLRVEQTLRSPVEATLAATLRDLWGQPAWTARLDARGVDPRRVNEAWPALALDAVVEGHGGFAPPWEMDRIDLSLPDEGTRLWAAGRLTFQETLEYTLDGRWENLAWPLQVSPQYRSPAGQFQLGGSGDKYRLAVEGDVEAPNFPPAHVAAQGDGDLASFRLDDFLVRTLDGRINGRGEVAWQPHLRWRAEVDARGVNPGAQWPDWPGRLDAKLTTTGKLDGALESQVNVQRLQGTLRDYPVAGHADVAIHNDTYRVKELLWRSADAELKAQGELGERWQMHWTVNAPNMASLWPDLGGRLNAAGTLDGERRQPHLTLQLSADQASLQTLHAGKIQGSLDVDLSQQQPSRVNLAVTDARVGELVVNEARLQTLGTLSDQHWLLAVRQSERYLNLELQGGYAEAAWRGELTKMEYNAVRAGRWFLEHPSTLRLSADAVSATRTCLSSEGAKVCAGGDWSRTGESNLQVELDALPTALAAPLMPEDWRWEDTLSGHANARLGQDLSLMVDGQIRLGPGKVSYDVADQEPLDLDYRSGELVVRTDKNGTRLSLKTVLNDEDHVEANLRLPEFRSLSRPDLRQPLTGHVSGRFHDMDLLSVFVPAVTEPRGTLQWNMDLGGTVDAPRISGSGGLTGGEAALPELGIKLTDITLRVNAADSRRLRWEGEARSGRGSLALNGEWRLDQPGWPLKAAVKGTDVEMVRRPGLLIVASPDLTADIQHRQVTLRGTVRVPQANVEMKGLPETAVSPSPDVVIVRRADEAAAPAPALWRVTTEIRLLPGELVNFEGFGLTCKVQGDLVLKHSTGKPFLGTGNLTIVNGQYLAFGIALDIEQGQLTFANSPMDNPAIDIRATRVYTSGATSIVTGLRAQGRLKDATLTLFSEPPMAESDILSYLLLGRPPGETTGSDADLLMAAAAAVGTSQAYVAAKRLAQSLGFEETRVTASGLVLGKSLSSRMYVTYEIGLLAPTNTLQIRYRLSERWTVKAESSDTESADLIYTIER